MQNDEIWKPIPGFEDLYEASSLGRIRSKSVVLWTKGEHNRSFQYRRKERILSPSYNQANGYLAVALCRDSKPQSYYVHRLVASAFLPNPDNLSEVNHKDENKTNNRVENLEWCSRTYNIRYGTGDERRKSVARTNKRGRCYPKWIAQYSLDGEYLCSFGSSEEAARAIGKPNSGGCIRAHARGERKRDSYAGYIWRYTDEPQPTL